MILTTKRITMFTVSLALFMDVLDSNVINTAIPTMAQSFKVNPIDLKIALIGYLLSLATFIPISGWTADKYGTKRVFIAAMGLFILSSFWCGYAHTLLELVIARCIQGVGGAFMISLGRLIIVRTFKRHELVEAMNTVVIVISMAVMLGPFIGGVITDHFSWPWIFWVNIPAGLFAILLASYGLKDDAPRKELPFDWFGFIALGSSMAMLCFSLSEMSQLTSQHHPGLLMFFSALLFIAFLFHAKRQRHPVIQINLFRIRTFQISVMGNLFTRLGFGGVPFLLPLLQQVGLGFSAELSGLLLVPMAFGIIISKLIASRVLRIIGYKRYLLVNTIIVGFILWSFQLVAPGIPEPTIALLTFLFGVGISAQFTAMNSLAFADLHEDQLSASTSITSTIQVLSQSFGVAIGAILLRYYSTYSQQLTPQAFHQTFFALGIITIFSSCLFLRLKSDDGKQMFMKHIEVESN